MYRVQTIRKKETSQLNKNNVEKKNTVLQHTVT